MAYYGRPPNGFVNQGFQGNFGNQAAFAPPPPPPNPRRTQMIGIAMVFTGLIMLVVLGAVGAVVGISLANFSIGGGATQATPTQARPQTTQTTTTTTRPTTTPATTTTKAPTTANPTTTKPTTVRPVTNRPATARPATNRPATTKAATNRPATAQPATTKAPTTVRPTAAPVEGDFLTTRVCGTRPVESRILMGTNAVRGHWPWIGSLQQGGGQQCGASLLNERWAVTAAHCFDTDNPIDNPVADTLVLGINNNKNFESGSVSRTFTAFHHPMWDPEQPRGENDITLLRLNAPVQYTDYISPVCLATLTEEVDKYDDCYVTGWGSLEDGADFPEGTDPPFPDILQQVSLPLIAPNTGTCQEGDLIICAGFPEGLKDACQGDSGGPLVCKNRDSSIDASWHLVGVVSSGAGCGKPMQPGSYTRITKFQQWLRTTIDQNGGP